MRDTVQLMVERDVSVRMRGVAANTRFGNGVLSIAPPSHEPADYYLYDPRHPVPTRGGALCCWDASVPGGAHGQRAIQERPAVLASSTPPLAHAVEVTGPILVRLWAASSAVDTGFTAKLVDVEPSGYARHLTDGIIHAHDRASTAMPTLLEPESVCEYTADLWATSHLFETGHRIRVEISSSNFPRFDRNPNTGYSFAQDAALRPAVQTILHDADHPSHIVLPIVSR